MSDTSALHRPLTRMFSLLLAVLLSALILLYPQPLAELHHGQLTLLLTALCIAFVHGVGFTPRSRIWRELLGPLPSWPPILYGLYHILTH